MYDICIVGAGIIGSAAARWVSQQEGKTVCLVGPLEPSDEEWKKFNRTIFGAHYDAGRIVSKVCCSRWNWTWPIIVGRTISRFRDLEKESGITFFNEVGCIIKSTKDVITEYRTTCTESDTQLLSPSGLSQAFPYLRSDDDTHAILESTNSGTVNPRKYISVNKKLSIKNGCDVIDDVVCEITEKHQDDGKVYMKAVTQNGRTISARRFLLCTGAFTNFQRLLPAGKEIDIFLTTEIAVMVEMYEEDVGRMSNMPTILVNYEDRTDPRNAYILPPIQYPDGKYYTKVGHGLDLNRSLTSFQNVSAWYRRQDNIRTDDFNSVYLRIHDTVTGFRPKSLHGKTCVNTGTPTSRYYCDMVTPTLGVVTGGNGSGVNAGDEVGRMAAQMIIKGEWDHDLPAELFKLRYKEKSVPKSQL